MGREARLAPDRGPRKNSAMEDYRCWAEKASELFLEIRESIGPKHPLYKRLDYFLTHDELPPKDN